MIARFPARETSLPGAGLELASDPFMDEGEEKQRSRSTRKGGTKSAADKPNPGRSVGAKRAAGKPASEKPVPESPFKAYGGGQEMPLEGYVWLLGAFGVAAVSVVAAAAATGRRLPERASAGEIALIGVATHKLTRIVTRDWVTAPLRAPFTRYEKSLGSGEVQESSRGEGVQRAIGDLLTCPFCTGPWIAGALFSGLVFSPRLTRLIAATFTSVAISDWLHNAYGILHEARKQESES